MDGEKLRGANTYVRAPYVSLDAGGFDIEPTPAALLLAGRFHIRDHILDHGHPCLATQCHD